MYPTVPQGMLLEHFWYVSDAARLTAYRSALGRVIEPGATVLDLGCGTGILGLLALQAGASRVIAVDASDMIVLAKEIADANGVGDKVDHRHVQSTDLVLDEPVDVVICDQVGAVGWDAGIIKYFTDAVDRSLVKANGVLLPGRLDSYFAPVDAPACREPIDGWGEVSPGIDLSAIRQYTLNRGLHTMLEADVMLAEPKLFDSRAATNMERMSATETFTVQRDGTLTGILGMARAWLDEASSFSNIPGSPDRSKRWQTHLPISEPQQVEVGDEIEITVESNLVSGRENWSVAIRGSLEYSSNHSTFLSAILHPGDR